MKINNLINCKNTLKIIGILSFILSFQQCKCGVKSVYDTVEGAQLHSEDPKVIDVAELDVENAKGLLAKIPNQNVAYFINSKDGKTYKFTKEDGRLVCRASGDLSKVLYGGEKEFDSNISGLFFAGDIQNPILHCVICYKRYPSLVHVYTLSHDQWTRNQKFMEIDLKADGMCCTTIQLGQKLAGCLCAQGNYLNTLKKAIKLYSVKDCSSTIDPNNEKTLMTVQKADGANCTLDSVTSVSQIEVGQILIGIKNIFVQGQVNKQGNQVTLDYQDFGSAQQLLKGSLYCIQDGNNREPNMSIPVFCCFSDTPSVYKMISKGAFVPIELPESIPKKHLVIPFSDALYLIASRKKTKPDSEQEATTSNSEDDKETIYYRTHLKGSFR